MNGELICFGISEHILKEFYPKWSEKAAKELNQVHALFKGLTPDQLMPRPAYNSTFSETNHGLRDKARLFLAIALVRELPIKNFYARSFVVYFTFMWGIFSLFGRGNLNQKVKIYYNHDLHNKPIQNHPDLFWWTQARTVPSLFIRENTHINWRSWQTPIFHQYHRCTYRYRYRKPRYLPWDGTMSQPVLPYFHDNGTGVINGTWKFHTNTSPRLH